MSREPQPGETGRLRDTRDTAARERIFADWQYRRHIRQTRVQIAGPMIGLLSGSGAGIYTIYDSFQDAHHIPLVTIPNGLNGVELGTGLALSVVGLAIGLLGLRAANRRIR